MHVFLIHGMGRTPASMWLLGRRLRHVGHTTHLFGYSVTFSSLDVIADRFAKWVNDTMSGRPSDGSLPSQPYAIVGHSLGNVITRLVTDRLPPGFRRLVMLAPPNQSPTMARRLANNPLFRMVTRDTGQRLADPSFFSNLAVPAVRALIIAGTAGPRSGRLPLGGSTNDGIVSLEESRLDGVPVITVPAMHTFLMNRRDVADAVTAFLAAENAG